MTPQIHLLSDSSLIRNAVETAYGAGRCSGDDLATMRRAFGSWKDRDLDGATWMDDLRSGSRSRRHSS